MRTKYKIFAGTLSLLIMLILAVTLYVQSVLPDNFYIADGEDFNINTRFSLTDLKVSGASKAFMTERAGSMYSLNLKLFDSVAVKQVQVQVVDRKMVVPGGCPFGIKMHTKGVLVVGMSDIQNGTHNINPAKDAGLKVGDILTHIDGMYINRNSDIARFIADCDGSEVKITAIRGNHEMDFYLTPVKSEYDDGYKAGIWVRDSSAGIGTMTYYDPETLKFGGLGHAVCDIDTGELMPLFSGEIVDVNISGVNIGHSGYPGELKGTFSSENPMGFLYANSEAGIFGVLNSPVLDIDPVPMALKQEIQPGPAQILSTVSGNKPESFDIEIEKVNYSDMTPTKNMVIKVVDRGLLSVSGGIVQGMSGSPILQNGKLVGAVTHVFVNDPTRGYGIFAENMDKILDNVEDYQLAA